LNHRLFDYMLSEIQMRIEKTFSSTLPNSLKLRNLDKTYYQNCEK
jgi:hypothetical protein